MKHPFKVGERYRNRNGEYEVIELKEPQMMIRYSDGRTLKTTIELQARIWQNIQAETKTEKQVQMRAPRPKRRGRQRGIEFQRLQDHDFQKGVGGTSWRARKSLGGLLAQQMSDTTQYFFQSYPIYRRAEVHIARPEYYHKDTRWQEAKFVFYLDTQDATYGFYIEKNNGPMDDTWHWLNFLVALENNRALQKKIQAAMYQQKLHWEIYVWDDGGLVAQTRADQNELKWEWESEEQKIDSISWSQFIERLSAIETNKWCDVYLCARTGKEQALTTGIHLAEQVTKAYRALLPLYEASTQHPH